MALATIPGYPRIGKHRELKRALERFWQGKITESELIATRNELVQTHWQTQTAAGLDLIPVNDFSFYDQMLDITAMFDAVPSRFRSTGEPGSLDRYFGLARGTREAPALEMTKWFDTNYHYLVPELYPDVTFNRTGTQPFTLLKQAQDQGIPGKVVLVGPLTWLKLSKLHDVAEDQVLEQLIPAYAHLIADLAAAGAEWIQLDEPVLVTNVTNTDLRTLSTVYRELSARKGASKLAVHTCFDHAGSAWETLLQLPVDAIGLDFVRGERNLDHLRASGFPDDKILVAGVIDGRNVWAADLRTQFSLLQNIANHVDTDRIHVSTSCSLQHVPYTVDGEQLNQEILPWLAFAEQKLQEVVLLTRGLNHGEESIASELDARSRVLHQASESLLRRNPQVRDRLRSLSPAEAERPAPFAIRAELQQSTFGLPELPTTTIGSFPQTADVRNARKRSDQGEWSAEQYEDFLKTQVQEVIQLQESIGIDVLVHGEFERNDMVQYFGEQLDGFAFTHNGWVQSYGSRCVRPPIIFGDVSRPKPMTVHWSTYAQSLTEKPVKGMLTGPVTILNWSFVRDDQPRSETCRQIALAIRDEVADLEGAGIRMIQIDEAALREGLPLRREDWQAYLDWAVESFRLASGIAKPETQIHTHMCYSEFGDIFHAIRELDADVISIENARSGQELLQTFRDEGYDKGIGPGVYDIHSPRVPPVEEMADAIEATLQVLPRHQIWVNPDCGLKTRKPEETVAALRNMVAAAQEVRSRILTGV